VRVSLEIELGGLAGALDHLGKAGRAERGATLGGEHERAFRILLTLEPVGGAVHSIKSRLVCSEWRG
jgi:hypothetical protein